MYGQIFIKNNFTYILILNFLLLSFFILSSFRPIPDSTHYLVSIVNINDFVIHDKINEIISYIKTPIYSFIGSIFISPNLYSIVSLFVNFLNLNLIFYLFIFYLNDNGLAFFLTCLIIFFKFIILVSYFFNIEILQSLNYFIMNIDLFGYFTVRQIFGIFYILILFFFIKKKYFIVSILVFINNFVHPNSNIFIIGIFGLYFLYLSISDKKNLKNLIFYFLSNLIYLIFIFLKINNFDTEINYEKSIYYSNLIRDEADDFSFLWTIAYRLDFIFLVMLFSIINILIYLKKYKFDFIIFLSLLPILIFFIGALVEYINLFTDFYFINFFIINLQPAWKILGYAFFPQMLILGFNLKNFFKKKEIIYKNSIVYFSIITIFVFLFVGVTKNFDELKGYYTYSFKSNFEKNYEDWLKNHSKENNYNFIPKLTKETNYKNYGFKENNIFNLKKNFSQNLEKPNLEELASFEENFNLIKKIKNIIPKNNGLIIPPYFLNARGIFYEYPIYYVEHPDGNFAMGNFKFFKEIHLRMLNLFKFGYSQMPNKQTNLNYSYIRYKYLQLKENEILSIKNKNNIYNYFITEHNHILNFPIVEKNKKYLIYKIE